MELGGRGRARVFRTYNYQEIRTPILEETQLFARGVGQETDIVSKEMYTFEDRDGSSLTLRPEATASVMRAYIEHRLDRARRAEALLHRPMFRRERPQKGRYRQFFQIGAEAIGSESPFVDAEVIEMVVEVLRRAGLQGFKLLLNSVGDPKCRPAISRNCCESAGAMWRRSCARIASAGPKRIRCACSTARCRRISRSSTRCRRFWIISASSAAAFRGGAQYYDRGIAYEVRPRMVRGLDYYMRTTFEIVHGALGAQNSVLGGGRYDGLAESLGSQVPAPGIGFSIGEDRLVMTRRRRPRRLKTSRWSLYLALMGEAARARRELARGPARARASAWKWREGS